jgi:hypothetical protein
MEGHTRHSFLEQKITTLIICVFYVSTTKMYLDIRLQADFRVEH